MDKMRNLLMRVDSLRTPANVVVKVFSPRWSLYGLLRLDDRTFCIDPWQTAMKWCEHMQSRGWEIITVNSMRSSRKKLAESVTVIMQRKT